MPLGPEKVRLNAYVSKKTKARIDALAKKEMRSISQMAGIAIEYGIDSMAHFLENRAASIEIAREYIAEQTFVPGQRPDLESLPDPAELDLPGQMNFIREVDQDMAARNESNEDFDR